MVILLLLAIVFFSVGIIRSLNGEEEIQEYTFDFSEQVIDEAFWLVGNWGFFQPSSNRVRFQDDALVLASNPMGEIPYMLSKPLAIQKGDVITFTREVQITRGNQFFAGGLSMYQTFEEDFIPIRPEGNWADGMGNGVFLVDYSYDLRGQTQRPGRDVFRLLAADWEENDNYHLVTPVYNQWIEEIIVFDTRMNQITYHFDGKTYKLSSYALDAPYVRFFMHPYGYDQENAFKIRNIKITIEDKSFKR